jgi:alanyl-tRNA synthetase
VLGEHARQKGSLVAPDRLRFDFIHPEALTKKQLNEIESGVNRDIFGDFPLQITYKPLEQAKSEGAMALFGEKYGETVRTITIGGDHPFSYELCGGTHVHETSDIGVCLITSESSVAAGIRRIEAVTGRKAYELIQHRFEEINDSANLVGSTVEQLPEKLTNIMDELNATRKQVILLKQNQVAVEFSQKLQQVKEVKGVNFLAVRLNEANAQSLRQMIDRFRQKYPTQGIIVVGSVNENRPIIIAGVTDDLVQRGIDANDLIKFVAAPIGGGGGGKPSLAQAGGKDASKLDLALASVEAWIMDKLDH